MNLTIEKLKLIFTETEKSIELPIQNSQNIIGSIILIILSLLFLLNNPLSPDVLSLSIFPLQGKFNIYTKTIISLLVQFIVIAIPFLVVFGKKGIQIWQKNIILIQLVNLIIVLIGFLYESAFWPLYKMLPIAGLTAQSIFDSIFLLYPLLIMMIFRYMILWIMAIKSGATSIKTIFLVIAHLTICIAVWIAWGAL